MLQETMTKKKPTPPPRLVRKREETHPLLVHFPIPTWNRLVRSIGNEWGKATAFVIQAIIEKLDREYPEK